MTEFVSVQIHGEIALVSINRPPANAMDLELLGELEGNLDFVEKPAGLIITGVGACFCAGLDLRVVPKYAAAQQRQLVASLNRLFTRIYDLPFPTVAAVNGHALAGGFFLALACDVRVGVKKDYQLGLPEVRVGVPYPEAAMRLAQAELSPATARQLVLSGDPISPDEAVALGVLDQLVEEDALVTVALEQARSRALLAAEIYARTKQQLREPALCDMRRIVEHSEIP